ncbi:MAG: glycoside hydrolase [Anaerolineae bacterium]
MSHPLYVAIVWHMHQPWYRHLETGEFSLPWVRLHATKDYLHMAELVREYPDVHVTFNLVPSLIEQLQMYAAGEAEDRCMALSRQEHWTPEEQSFLLSFFFHINWHRVIQGYPPYWRLLNLRQAAPDMPAYFSEQYYRDLAAWFNLAWIDPNWLERDAELSALAAKGSGYSAQDIARILAKQQEIISRVLPAYQELAARGQVEISVSPYYHPILPLLIDTSLARRASPDLPLPAPAFAHPEDAEEQVRRAVEYHQQLFGTPPRGMWPSEGAVCPEIVPMLARHGFAWFASDEAILARSLGVSIERDDHGNVLRPQVLYQPYYADHAPGAPAVIFRDRELSDRIGFVYQRMKAEDAVNDLMLRLYIIRDKVLHLDQPFLVSIILDGENAWEEYERNGDPFLRRLYERLTREREYIRSVTVSEYLQQFGVRESLPRLATGSWIAGNLETWIGEPAQNTAWVYLKRARDDLVAWQESHPKAPPAMLERAWQAVYIAEGSDWFWWYYSRNNPAGENLFDLTFRQHLRTMYRTLGMPVPAWLEVPILVEPARLQRVRLPRAPIHPSLAAAPQAGEEWRDAGYLDLAPAGGSMQRGTAPLKGMYVGGDGERLYLRLEGGDDLAKQEISIYLTLLEKNAGAMPQAQPRRAPAEENWLSAHWEIRLQDNQATLFRPNMGGDGWMPAGRLNPVVGKGVYELALPYADLGCRPGDILEVRVVLYLGTAPAETGALRFPLPMPAEAVTDQRLTSGA